MSLKLLLTVDSLVPGDPTGVTVPAYANGNVSISFTPGTEANPAAFNIKACTSGCTTGCVGETTTTNSPGTISAGVLSQFDVTEETAANKTPERRR